jgi:hypothetical protein
MTNELPTYDHARPGAGLRPYRVRMTCGHGEWRLMREATAGIPWTPDAVVNAPSMPCARCWKARQSGVG